MEFSAKIYKLGINPCVDIPGDVSRSLSGRGYMRVKGTLNGLPIRATLIPAGNGQHRLFINGEMRKKSGVDVGDEIHLALELDTEPRVVPVPPRFAEALEKNREAKAIFYSMLPSRRKEILDYLNWLKKTETLERNIEKVIIHLLKKKR